MKYWKSKLFIAGIFIASMSLTCCDEEKENPIQGITVTPESVAPMEIGQTTQLTATITPTDADDIIRWYSYDSDIVSVTKDGATATLTALSAGTTKVFATNRSGIVVSQDILITVNSGEYAAEVAGNYLGTAKMSGALSGELSDVSIAISRISGEKSKVKLNIVADVPGMGEMNISGDNIVVGRGSTADTYTFSGGASIVTMGNIPLAVSGTLNAATKALTLNLEAEGVITVVINATPGAAVDYAKKVEGDYAGTAKVSGAISADVSELTVALTRTGAGKVDLNIVAEVPGMGQLVVTGEDIAVKAGDAENTYALSGKAVLAGMGFNLNVTGTYNETDKKLIMKLAEENGLVAIDIEATVAGDIKPNPDYGAILAGSYSGNATLTGMINETINDVPVTMERRDENSVKFTIVATVTGFGAMTIVSENMTITPSDTDGEYLLDGDAKLPVLDMPIKIIGEYIDATGELNVTLAAEGVVNINYSGSRQ
jgi:hypothetical protein